jgi:hypothetical protein
MLGFFCSTLFGDKLLLYVFPQRERNDNELKTMFRRGFIPAILIMLALIMFSSCLRKEGEPQDTASPSPSTAETAAPTSPPTTSPPSDPVSETESPAIPKTAPPETLPPETLPPAETHPPSHSDAILTETEDMGQEYIDKIIFLGDSTTYGMKYYGVLSEGKNTKQVWTPASGTLTLSNQSFATIVYPVTGEEIPIRDAVALEKPDIMVITLGVNGVSFMEEDYFKSEYKMLVEDIKEISPDTKIILQSIFPVASNYEYQRDINNTKIINANSWILDVAEETGVKYLDTISILLGEDGFLPQEYHNGDGLHLNESSFKLVIDYIRTHGYK